MRKLLILFVGLFMLVPSVGWAQQNTNTLPPECAMASMVAGSCTPLRQGVRVRASGSTAGNCEVAGGAVVTCEYDGSNWIAVLPGTYGGDLTIGQPAAATFGAPNEMIADPTALNQFVGIPRIGSTIVSPLNNGTTSVAAANPLLANCNAVVDGTEADDAVNFITGTSSYRYTWAADVATDDGIDCVIAYPAVTDPISFGFWFRTDTAITSGDIDINFDDGGVTDGTYSTLAVTDLNEWQWIELNITTACAGECASVDGIEFLATAQGAVAGVLDGAIINIDQMAMWKAADEEAIGDVQIGGVVNFYYALHAAAGVNNPTAGVEWTSHFINYQTGADALIPITDLSTYYGVTLEALK